MRASPSLLVSSRSYTLSTASPSAASKVKRLAKLCDACKSEVAPGLTRRLRLARLGELVPIDAASLRARDPQPKPVGPPTTPV